MTEDAAAPDPQHSEPDSAPPAAQEAPGAAPAKAPAAEASPAPELGSAIPDQPSAEPSRRDVLAKAACALGACAFAGAGGVVGAAVVGTPLQGGEAKTWWCPLGPADDFPQGPRKLPVRAAGRDAWRRFADRSLGRVVVVKEGEDLRAFSAACPHNGCDVSVAEGGAELLCPCHHSRFALDGERIEGQSPRGLDPLVTRVREGQLEVEWKRFALGTPERKPV
jgi:quinol---cytochrome c reductase iron-sulfur subunit, bacillus type